jgi:hypothetical protein
MRGIYVEQNPTKSELPIDGDSTKNNSMVSQFSPEVRTEKYEPIGCEAGDIYLRDKHGSSSKEGYWTDICVVLIILGLIWAAFYFKKI